MRRLSRLLLPVALTVFGSAAALGAAELVVRFLPALSGEKPPWSDRPPFYFAAEESATLQDYAYPERKTPGTFRVAVVGDSFSFAPYMQFTDAFPKVLERMLRLNGNTRPVEVVNMGVPAYSTSHEVLPVRQAVAGGADLVLLQITLNDPELKALRPIGITRFDTWGPPRFEGWKKEVIRRSKLAGLVVTRIHNTLTARRYVEYFHDLFDRPATWNSYSESTRRIAETCRAAGTPLVAVVFPLFGTPLDDGYPFSRIHEKVGGFLAEIGVPALDLLPLYRGIPVERLQVIPGEDRHPNEIGHRMAAERIYQWLVARGSIPEEFVIRKRFSRRVAIRGEPAYHGE